ncbi:MAG: hypothetical protein AAB588_01610 [Patescibacteria group bacterium]
MHLGNFFWDTEKGPQAIGLRAFHRIVQDSLAIAIQIIEVQLREHAGSFETREYDVYDCNDPTPQARWVFAS